MELHCSFLDHFVHIGLVCNQFNTVQPKKLLTSYLIIRLFMNLIGEGGVALFIFGPLCSHCACSQLVQYGLPKRLLTFHSIVRLFVNGFHYRSLNISTKKCILRSLSLCAMLFDLSAFGSRFHRTSTYNLGTRMKKTKTKKKKDPL